MGQAFLFFGISFLLLVCCDGKPPVLSSKEKVAVDKLRAAVGHKLTAKYMQTDAYLIKWVKAKKFDDLEAKRALEKTLEWRNQVNADNFPLENISNDLIKNYPMDFSCRDRDGAAVLLIPFGDWDLRRKAVQGKLDELAHRMDWAEEYVAQLNFNLTQNPSTLAIVDMIGFSARKSACVGCVPFYVTWTIHHELYYPYNAYKMLLINTPAIFDPIFNAMRPFMTASTRDALMMQGYDRTEWTKEIEKTVDLDTLPLKYGGTGKKKKRDNNT